MKYIQGVDVFRVIAIISVIAIHTTPFNYDDNSQILAFAFINQISRYAVPLFFIFAGYFWAKKVSEQPNEAIKLSIPNIKRLLFLFIFWNLLFLIPFDPELWFSQGGFSRQLMENISYSTESPVRTMIYGTKSHLWFLMSLIGAIVISAFFMQFRQAKALYVFAAALYVFAVLAKAYAHTPIGIDLGFNTRNGPFFGTIFFVTGIALSHMKIEDTWIKSGVLLFLAGFGLHAFETYILWSQYDLDLTNDFVFSTYFMSVGVAVIALSNHKRIQIDSLSSIGHLTLGIYLVHFIFVDVFQNVDADVNHPIWEVGYVFIVFALSALLTLILKKNKLSKKLVS